MTLTYFGSESPFNMLDMMKPVIIAALGLGLICLGIGSYYGIPEGIDQIIYSVSISAFFYLTHCKR